MPKKTIKSKKLPLVSIVLRSKNEQKTIGAVLKTLCQQSFKNFEIIHVDDNSIDKTREIVKQFSKKLSISTILLRPGEFTHSYSQNLGASKSRGKYICFLPGHALPFTNTWLEDGLKNFDDPHVAGVSGHYTENPLGYYSRKKGYSAFLKESRKSASFDPWMTNTNSIIRLDLWKQYPFDEKLPECEDYDWACEMLARDYNIIKDINFSVVHSHRYLGKPGYDESLPRWKKICAMIDKRKRPRKSFTKIKIK